MKKQYIFIFLIVIMLYLIYLVASYKYNEYRIISYREDIVKINLLYEEKIRQAQEILENRATKAYKNKVLKSEQNLKNPWEELIFFIAEEKYNTYTGSWDISTTKANPILSVSESESLIQTMTIPQKWIYLIFKKDTR